MVTAAAIMKLVEGGKLLLTDPVSQYIPAFASLSIIDLNTSRSASDYLVFPATSQITIHHLLTHTSGLSHAHLGVPVLGQLYHDAHISAGLYNYDERTGTNCEMSARLARLPLLFEPGSQYHEGANYEVLQCIIKVVSGMSPIQYIQDEIFQPLGMVDVRRRL
jgi:CubicO group peptidase (beta-lactamase class C family)